MSHRKRRSALCAVALTAVLAALWSVFPPRLASTAAAYRTRVMDQREEGEVLVNGSVAIRIRSGAGGLSAAERAQRVAQRLDDAIAKGLRPDSINPGTVNGEAAVLADGMLLITADRFHAQINETTPTRLAAVWAHNLRRALAKESPSETSAEPVSTAAETSAAAPTSGEPAGSEPAQTAGALTAVPSPPYYPDWSAGAKKYVPILSIGNPGVRVGACQVQGPKEQVDKVKAVAELLLAMHGGAFRMKVYIPVDSITLTHLHRVQGCSVAGFVDIKILSL